MNIKLSDHFTYGKLLRFTLSSIVMMVFTSIYGMVDGYFVSNYVGSTPFAAVNLIYPYIGILGAVGFMFGTGGSALVAKTLGMGDNEGANRIFSLIIYVAAGLGVLIAVIGIVFLRPIAGLLGAEGQLVEDCVTYGTIILIALPAFMLQMAFQSFFITAEKPQLGLAVTIAAGCTNMVLDALFVAVFEFGLAGAAWATALSQMVGGFVPLFYFFPKNKSLLRLGKTRFDGRALLRTCTNGSSEMMSNISGSLVSMLYNMQLMKYAGEGGVVAYGVLMYVSFIFFAVFIGYSIGTAPIIGFHYGAGNRDELKNILKRSTVIIGVTSVVMFALSQLLATPLSTLYVGYDDTLLELTKRGFFIFSFSFIFSGFAMYGSGFFTALNDGLTSAIIAFLRTLVFQIGAVMLLPLIWEIDGVWLSIVAADFASLIVAVVFLVAKRKKYGYM